MNFFRRPPPPVETIESIEDFYRETEEVRQAVQDKHDRETVATWKSCVRRATSAGNSISSVRCPCGVRAPSEVALLRCSTSEWVVEATLKPSSGYQYVLTARKATEGQGAERGPKVRGGEAHPLES